MSIVGDGRRTMWRLRRFWLRRAVVGVCATPVALAGCAHRSGAPGVTEEPARVALNAADAGRLPAGWTPLVANGSAANTDWQVTTGGVDAGACALSLVRNDNGRGQFNLCVCDRVKRADVKLSAWCRGDYGVGIVWRCRDADNYYVCRVNPAEGNFNLYKVVGGQRTRLASAPLRRFVDGQWYPLWAAMTGDEINCGIEGGFTIQARDAALPAAGRIGVWTRADALGSFSRIEVKENDEPRGE